MNEIWKDIPGFEGAYQVSNLGQVRSLDRYAMGGKHLIKKRGRTLKPSPDHKGYLQLTLSKHNKQYAVKIHQLVWDVFGDKPRDGIRLQVDHIDNDRRNNNIENLQLLSQRDNTCKAHSLKNNTSRHTGVYWEKACGKWRAQISVKRRNVHLGVFLNELDAARAYQNFKSNLVSKGEVI